ncbi:unnamed protein product [Onchocerca flexuosa]|uniref:Ovule protein n=1 Tax=Onchocerca flexuosa TaxID=387005 RepID=A0A183HEJ6_9BILA|nr:unnamed protein product [Onchocerca flexuosa]
MVANQHMTFDPCHYSVFMTFNLTFCSFFPAPSINREFTKNVQGQGSPPTYSSSPFFPSKNKLHYLR